MDGGGSVSDAALIRSAIGVLDEAAAIAARGAREMRIEAPPATESPNAERRLMDFEDMCMHDPGSTRADIIVGTSAAMELTLTIISFW